VSELLQATRAVVCCNITCD